MFGTVIYIYIYIYIYIGGLLSAYAIGSFG